MKVNACGQTWEIAALEEGRLGDSTRDRVKAHIASCATCREAAEGVLLLRADVADAAESLDDLALRRLRTKVLRDADAQLRGAAEKSGKARRSRSKLLLLGLAASAAAALVGIVVLLSAGTQVPARKPSDAPVRRAQAEPSAGAVWTRSATAGFDRMVLLDGTLHVRVDRARGDAPVRVVTPDAVVDDVGTVFTVEVVGGRTRGVRVEEGRVSIAFDDGRRVELASGQQWNAPPAADDVVANPVVERISADARGVRRVLPSAPAPRQEVALPRSADEDADYLVVVAAERAGRSDETRRAAQQYLARHPDGFRRPEVEALLAEER